LIGTSFALALRSAAGRMQIVGFDSNRSHARTARRRGAVDEVAASVDSAIAGADIIVLATPLPEIIRLLPRAIARAKSGSFIIDVGPLFGPFVKAARASLARRAGEVQLVLGHPLAGREFEGPAAAESSLFENRPFALFAPPQRWRAKAWKTAEQLVRLLGATPVRIDPSEHDRLIASTSALPQLASVAVALAAQRSTSRRSRQSIPKLAGSGFDSVTRLANSPFSIWSAALSANAANVARTLAALEAVARDLRSALQSGNLAKIEADFRAAAAARRRILRPGARSAATRKSSGHVHRR